ncbi:hypothetical protein ABT026_05525 [Streptomyces sp. NPDC002734]|uniref:hypothetical protein n=1 Tax=Streptomyces sp. NPDC002734 TaxID=3154426 RepID=UPI00331E3507
MSHLTTPTPPPQWVIAGAARLDDVLAELRAARPVFHSEADLQHAFAQALTAVAPDVRARLEVPVRRPGLRAEYLDLLCLGPTARTAVEFKYVTRRWAGEAGSPPEEFDLRHQGAPDLARRDFVFDIERLERFCRREDQNGLALLITNEPALWLPQPEGRPRTRDHEFRLHDGRTLAGTLRWAEGGYAPNTRVLRGVHPLTWRSYAQLGGPGGDFRCLAVLVDP